MSAPGPILACDAVVQRLSDFREGTLAEPWAGRVAAHLDQCPECVELHGAVGEVSLLLHVEVPEPPAGLEERVAEAAMSQLGPIVGSPPDRWPQWLRTTGELWRLAPVPLAAAIAVALSGSLLLGLPEERLPESARRLRARADTARELVMERQERLMEDVGALRLVLGGAFSSRVERIQEQLEDYRRLVGAPARRPAPRSVAPEATRSFENFPAPAPVAVGAGQVAPPPRPTRA